MIGTIIGRLALVLVAAGIFVATQTLYVVDERDQVIITQVGQYLYSVQEPGLYAKIPFYHNAIRFEKRILINDAPPGEYLTVDQKRLVADHITRWQIVDPFAFFITVQNELNARARLDDIVFSEMRAELARFNFDRVISDEREPIMARVSERAAARAAPFGVLVLDVRLKRADLPEEVQQSVFARMVAERGREAARYRAEGDEIGLQIRAGADRERTVILARAYETAQTLRGEGDAQAANIYAQAFQQDEEFYAFVRSLEAYERFLPGGSSLVLSTESELFRYLQTPGNNQVPATQQLPPPVTSPPPETTAPAPEG